MTRRGFTLIDLLFAIAVVVVALILLFQLFMNSLDYAKEHAREVVCGNALRSIGQAIALYRNENSGACPILPDLPTSRPVDYKQPLRLGNGPPTADSLGTGAQQNLCLLVSAGTVNWDHFLCPSVGTTPPVRQGQYGMGTAQKSYCDYGLQIPYSATPEGVNTATIQSFFNSGHNLPIMADQPDRHDLAQFSSNHGNGENVLFIDNSVKWCEDKRSGSDRNTTGYAANNIYTLDKWGPGQKLVSNGNAAATPTNLNARFDSVIYAWQP